MELSKWVPKHIFSVYMQFKIILWLLAEVRRSFTVSNNQVYSNDEFDLCLFTQVSDSGPHVRPSCCIPIRKTGRKLWRWRPFVCPSGINISFPDNSYSFDPIKLKLDILYDFEMVQRILFQGYAPMIFSGVIAFYLIFYHVLFQIIPPTYFSITYTQNLTFVISQKSW